MSRYHIATGVLPGSGEEPGVHPQGAFISVIFHFVEFDFLKIVPVGEPIELDNNEPPQDGILKGIEIKKLSYKKNFAHIIKTSQTRISFKFNCIPSSTLSAKVQQNNYPIWSIEDLNG